MKIQKINTKYLDEYCDDESDFVNVDDITVSNKQNILDDEKLD